MHLADCKGVTSLVQGGVLEHLLRDRRLGNNKVDRMARINEFLRD